MFYWERTISDYIWTNQRKVWMNCNAEWTIFACEEGEDMQCNLLITRWKLLTDSLKLSISIQSAIYRIPTFAKLFFILRVVIQQIWIAFVCLCAFRSSNTVLAYIHKHTTTHCILVYSVSKEITHLHTFSSKDGFFFESQEKNKKKSYQVSKLWR